MRRNNPLYVESMGFYLHKKLEIHLLITAIFNAISFLVVVGLFNLLNFPLIVYDEIIGIIIYSLINTAIIEVIKIFIIRHFADFVLKTKGLIFLVIDGLTFWITSEIFVENFSFRPVKFVTILIFTVSFFIMKVLLVITLQRVSRKDEEDEKLD